MHGGRKETALFKRAERGHCSETFVLVSHANKRWQQQGMQNTRMHGVELGLLDVRKDSWLFLEDAFLHHPFRFARTPSQSQSKSPSQPLTLREGGCTRTVKCGCAEQKERRAQCVDRLDKGEECGILHPKTKTKRHEMKGKKHSILSLSFLSFCTAQSGRAQQRIERGCRAGKNTTWTWDGMVRLPCWCGAEPGIR